MESISLNNPLVQTYLFYSGVLAIKLLLMSVLTARVRLAKQVFSNEEDLSTKDARIKLDDPDVERMRRAHLNDLENIPAFWILGALYLTTGPAVAWGRLLFRIYAGGRMLHTMVYAIKPLPQPARGMAFGIPLLVKLYMGFQVVLYYITAL